MQERNAKLLIIGLGHVGLPTALSFAHAGYDVYGFDSDQRKVQALSKGVCDSSEPEMEKKLRDSLRNGRFTVVNEPVTAIRKADVIVICVPTPVVERTPRLNSLKKAFHTIELGLHAGVAIFIESTVPPLTTLKFARRIKKLGYKPDLDVLLAYCPERLAPGSAFKELADNPRIIGGIGLRSGTIASDLYRTVANKVIVTDHITAEISKLAENTFRDINIAYANSLAMLSKRLGADVMSVIKVANTHPRVRIHLPGLGVGGPCLPKDPFLLAKNAPRDAARLIELARRLNDRMAKDAVQTVTRALILKKKTPGTTKITVLGISYKPDTEDTTNSPSATIIRHFLRTGAKVYSYDPLTAETFGSVRARNITEAIADSDCILIATAHGAFKTLNLEKIRQNSKKDCVLYDGPRILNPSNFRSHRVLYFGTGYGLPANPLEKTLGSNAR